MINKKILMAIFVIAIVLVAGTLLTLKYSKGNGAATGQAINVPKGNETSAPANEPVKTVDSTQLEAITEGLSTSKVLDLLGEPTDKQTVTTPKGNVIEYWYYTDSNKNVWQIGFSADEVSVVRKY